MYFYFGLFAYVCGCIKIAPLLSLNLSVVYTQTHIWFTSPSHYLYYTYIYNMPVNVLFTKRFSVSNVKFVRWLCIVRMQLLLLLLFLYLLFAAWFVCFNFFFVRKITWTLEVSSKNWTEGRRNKDLNQKQKPNVIHTLILFNRILTIIHFSRCVIHWFFLLSISLFDFLIHYKWMVLITQKVNRHISLSHSLHYIQSRLICLLF